MRLESMLARGLSITTLSVALAAGFTVPAPAAAAGRPVVPNDTDQWGNDKIRVAATAPATLSVGASGATMQSTSDSGSGTSSLHGGAGALPADGTAPSVDYCVELDLADASSGPYRLRFHVDGAGGDSTSSAPGRLSAASRSAVRRRLPLTGGVTLTFNLSTAADTWVTTTGDAALLGAIYDGNANLVAGDDSGGRIAASLPAGDYSLLLQGTDQLTGTFTAMADQGTCGN